VTEQDRLDFLVERDGVEGAIQFAIQGLAVYTEASIRCGPYKSSIETYKGFLAGHDIDVKFVVAKKMG